jgi:hypothetical protein
MLMLSNAAIVEGSGEDGGAFNTPFDNSRLPFIKEHLQVSYDKYPGMRSLMICRIHFLAWSVSRYKKTVVIIKTSSSKRPLLHFNVAFTYFVI